MIVCLLRILVGATFVVSGLSKSIDIWGFTYKIEHYLMVWGMDVSRPLVMLGASLLSYTEFLLGVFVLFGCYRRVSVWLSSALMLFMTAFSVYMVAVDPVADCGCFGELIQVPNAVTLLKNIALCVALVYLLLNNRKVKGFYNTYLHWVVGLFSILYIILVGYFGIAAQPLLDFRDFKVETPLFDDEAANVDVIYEKNGETRKFTADNLPDSTWTFVDVANDADARLTLSVFAGVEEGDELTDSVASLADNLILVSIPEIEKAPKSAIAKIQRLKEFCDGKNIHFVVVAGSGIDAVENWRRLSLNKYDILTADDTTLEALVRGEVGVVYVRDNMIKWKYTLDLIASDDMDEIMELGSIESAVFIVLTIGYLLALLILKIIDFTGRRLKPVFFGKRKKAETEASASDEIGESDTAEQVADTAGNEQQQTTDDK